MGDQAQMMGNTKPDRNGLGRGAPAPHANSEFIDDIPEMMTADQSMPPSDQFNEDGGLSAANEQNTDAAFSAQQSYAGEDGSAIEA